MSFPPIPPHSRRALDATDESTKSYVSYSTSFREDIRVAQDLQQQLSAPEKLRYYLSSGSVISTHSAFADRQQSVSGNVESQKYELIGQGGCGIVFEIPGLPEVTKRAIQTIKKGESQESGLWNDCRMHHRIYSAFKKANFGAVHVPAVKNFVPHDCNEWWQENGPKFDAPFDKPADMLISERILPLPLPVREALINCFCPEGARDLARASKNNESCLIQPLFGRRRAKILSARMTNLRNFELDVGRMEALNMKTDDLVNAMAQSLALMHFKAHVDANDVEFVLGTRPAALYEDLTEYETLPDQPPKRHLLRPSKNGVNFRNRLVHLWLIDFNMVHAIPDSSKFVSMAVDGFVLNSKPFFPRPRFGSEASTNDTRNWAIFKTTYMNTSKRYCPPAEQNLPVQFIGAIENHFKSQYNKQHQNIKD